ncbi:MAG: phage portal protein, partial [Chloroflexi bacterium]|nr:phage portal protein [Chloroflexota bacterium]
RRKTRIAEIEYEWRKGETVLDVSPYQMRLRSMLQRTDEALQTIGAAYWYKLRSGSGKITGFRWLDPRSMSPDESSVEVPKGYTRYRRVVSGGIILIPSDDLIVFSRMGLGEFAPAPSAAIASKLATEILYFSDESERKVKQDPLPVSLISVPAGTGEKERDRLKNTFWRLFNRSTKASPENRVVPVFDGVNVERLSMTPEELDFATGRNPSIEAVVSSHGVPMSELVGNAANFATAELDTQNFISRLGSRLDDIAEEVNQDWEVLRDGFVLSFYVDRHPAMQKDEVETSTAFLNYSQILTPEAAAYQVGITEADFPAGMEIFKTEPEVIEPEIIATPTTEKAYIEDLRRWRRKAMRKKGACEFESDTIPADIKAKINLQLTAGADVKSVFDKYIQAQSDIEPEPKEDTKSLESALELAIKMM